MKRKLNVGKIGMNKGGVKVFEDDQSGEALQING
jgi:hypothetical protein